MYCSKCGNLLPDGARFCSKCGTAVRQEAEAPVQAPQPAQQPVQQSIPQGAPVTPANKNDQAQQPQKKGMSFKRLLISAVIIAVFYFIGNQAGQLFGKSISGNSGASNNGTETNPSSAFSSSLTDMLTLRAVLMKTDGALNTYQVFYYGNDTHRLSGWSIVTAYKKDTGYTVESLKQSYDASTWPSFTTVRYFDESGYVLRSVDMKNLNSVDRVRELIQYDVIRDMPEDQIALGALDADSLIESLRALDFTDANVLDYPMLHLQ